MEPEKVTIGPHTLYLGDCREILPMLGKFDLCLTDPPYGMNALDGSRTARLYGINRRENWDCKKPGKEIFDFIFSCSNHQIIWGFNYFIEEINRSTKFFMVWDKPSMSGMRTMAFGEIAYTSLSGPAKIFRFESENKRSHPTQKPVPLMAWCLGFAPDAKTVIDPFMGSGTTGVACAQLGRIFTGIERERKYFDIACERMARAHAQGRIFEAEPEAAPVQEALFA